MRCELRSSDDNSILLLLSSLILLFSPLFFSSSLLTVFYSVTVSLHQADSPVELNLSTEPHNVGVDITADSGALMCILPNHIFATIHAACILPMSCLRLFMLHAYSLSRV